MATPKFEIVGYGERQGLPVPVVSGAWLFSQVDGGGLPLSICIQMCRDHGLLFDLIGYCRAAVASGNYSEAKLRAALGDVLCGVPAQHVERVLAALKGAG